MLNQKELYKVECWYNGEIIETVITEYINEAFNIRCIFDCKGRGTSHKGVLYSYEQGVWKKVGK